MERIGERIDNEIPPTQAAYRKGRSTTEHVFSTKLVIERTITSRNETVYLMMYDMSKAFDSVNRTVLINNLNKILEKDEVHLLKLMIGAPHRTSESRIHEAKIRNSRYHASLNFIFTFT